MARLAAALSGLLLLASCSTQPVSTSDAREVKSAHWSEPQAGSAQLIVKRDSGLMGAACKVGVFVDGQEVASLGTSEKVVLHLTPGKHMLGARNGTICGKGLAEASVELAVGSQTIYRIAILDAGGILIQPTAF
jgi:hypothetical protein